MKRALGQTAKAIATPLFRERVYTVHRGPARGLRRKGGFGWVPERLWPSTPEHEFLRSLSLAGKTVYDIGAFEGVVTMYFARAVREGGRVVAFEPNPANARRLRENLALNGLRNVDVHEIALASEPGKATLRFTAGEGGHGTLVAHEPREAEVTVPVETVDALVARGFPVPALIKIDVEGFERPVVVGARETLKADLPELIIEIHGASEGEKRANVKGVLAELLPFGYTVRHLESSEAVTTENPDVALRGHLVCRADGHRPE